MNAHQSVADFTAEEGAGFLQVSVQVSPGDQLAALLTGLGVQLTLSLVVDLCLMQSVENTARSNTDREYGAECCVNYW